MAMTAAQTTAELQRKKNLGIMPTNQANMAEYNRLTAQPSVQSQAVQAVRNNTPVTPQPVTHPTTRANETLSGIRSQIDQPAFEFRAPTPFSYDKNTDPYYQQAVAAARQNIEQQQLDTNAQLRASGQGKSSYSEAVANQIGASEMANVDTNILPKLIDQAYARWSNEADRDLQIQQANYGVGQDRLSNLANLYGLYNQEDFSNPMAEAQLTGSYLSGEARQYIEAINELKRQAESPGITREARAALSGEADNYRAALAGIGIDSSLFGSDVNRNTSMQNLSRAGVQTLDARQIANQEKQQIFQNEMVQRQFDEDVRQFGIQSALQRQVQLGNLSINQAQLLLAQDDNDRQWATLDWQMQKPQGGGAEYRGLNASQILSNIQSRYSDPVYRKDANGNVETDLDGRPIQSGTQITTDPTKRERMFLDVVDANLPTDTETYQVLTMLGLTKAEIDKYMKKYSGN